MRRVTGIKFPWAASVKNSSSVGEYMLCKHDESLGKKQTEKRLKVQLGAIASPAGAALQTMPHKTTPLQLFNPATLSQRRSFSLAGSTPLSILNKLQNPRLLRPFPLIFVEDALPQPQALRRRLH